MISLLNKNNSVSTIVRPILETMLLSKAIDRCHSFVREEKRPFIYKSRKTTWISRPKEKAREGAINTNANSAKHTQTVTAQHHQNNPPLSNPKRPPNPTMPETLPIIDKPREFHRTQEQISPGKPKQIKALIPIHQQPKRNPIEQSDRQEARRGHRTPHRFELQSLTVSSSRFLPTCQGLTTARHFMSGKRSRERESVEITQVRRVVGSSS